MYVGTYKTGLPRFDHYQTINPPLQIPPGWVRKLKISVRAVEFFSTIGEIYKNES